MRWNNSSSKRRSVDYLMELIIEIQKNKWEIIDIIVQIKKEWNGTQTYLRFFKKLQFYF